MISDPTARGDEIAARVRDWYEASRESWWQRHAPIFLGGNHCVGCADNFMLGLIAQVNQITADVNAL